MDVEASIVLPNGDRVLALAVGASRPRRYRRLVDVKYFRAGELHVADCLTLLRGLPDGCVDLAYADPPFFTGRDFGSFDDVWDGDLDGYLAWLLERLAELRRTLAPTGQLALHLDWHAGHHAKVELDRLFGRDCFVTEIVWNYGSASGGRAKANRPVKAHDLIFLYSREPGRHTYNRLHLPYDERYLRERFCYEDERGRYQRRNRGAGRIDRQYLADSPGVPLSTVWSDIRQTYAMHLVKRRREETGYPTQKPEALLERIVRMASNEGDLVADVFCGSGTTPAVAARLRRRFIACDVSPEAVRIAATRLASVNDADQHAAAGGER